MNSQIMKKYFYLLLCAMFALSSCSNDDSEDNPQTESEEYTGKLSDLELLEDCLVQTDSVGNILGYLVGANLNEADPTEISVPVNTYEEAVELFKKWLPEDAQLIEENKKITWKMTDEGNQEEGETILKESTNPGEIANVSIRKTSQTENAPIITSVKFIPFSAWPENSTAIEEYLEEKYYLAAEVEVTENKGASTGTYVVIREWSPQEAGIMIRFSGDTWEAFWDGYNRDNCSSVGTTQTVSQVLHQGSNYDYFVNNYGPKHNWPNLHERFITKTITTDWDGTDYRWFVRLNSGEADTFTNKMWKNPSYTKVYIYWFIPQGNSVKIW